MTADSASARPRHPACRAGGLDENDRAGVPRHGLAMAEAVSALEQSFAEVGSARTHRPVVPEQVLGAPEVLAEGPVEERRREPLGDLLRECLQMLVGRQCHRCYSNVWYRALSTPLERRWIDRDDASRLREHVVSPLITSGKRGFSGDRHR